MGGLCCTGLQEGGKDEIIEKLLSLGFDIDSTSNDGITPLMVLACHDTKRIKSDFKRHVNNGWGVQMT